MESLPKPLAHGAPHADPNLLATHSPPTPRQHKAPPRQAHPSRRQHMAPPPAQLPPGTLLSDRYQIESFLGAGGMAAVYLAWDKTIERRVAIKILNQIAHIHDARAYQAALARFRREAQLAARVRHPNAITIFDMGVTDNEQPYIVMDMVEGWELDHELRQHGPLDPRRALPMFCRCLDALAQGHALGIVHKDIKPSNLMLRRPHTPQEDLLVMDFGVAGLERYDDDKERLTAAGTVLGTPQYLPVEYSRDRVITASMDVYQVALTLVEALTATPVVRENHPMSAMLIHVQRQVALPAGLLRSPLGPILRKALAWDHRARYPDAAAFAAALREIDPDALDLDLGDKERVFIQQQPAAAAPPADPVDTLASTAPSPTAARARDPLTAPLLAAAAALLLLIAGVVALSWGDDAAPPAALAPPQPRPAPQPAPPDPAPPSPTPEEAPPALAQPALEPAPDEPALEPAPAEPALETTNPKARGGKGKPRRRDAIAD